MIIVGMKRKLDMKNYHKLGMIRPVKIYQALVYLKDHHPDYKEINIENMNQWIKEFLSFEEEENTSESSYSDEIESSSLESECHVDESTEKNLNETENMYTSVTCLVPEEPLTDVIGKFLAILLSIHNRESRFCTQKSVLLENGKLF